jgi:hypothetical protein
VAQSLEGEKMAAVKFFCRGVAQGDWQVGDQPSQVLGEVRLATEQSCVTRNFNAITAMPVRITIGTSAHNNSKPLVRSRGFDGERDDLRNLAKE